MARVTAAVNEFINLWACGANASLKLDTSNGGCTVNFTAHLGHPGAMLQASHTPPSSPSFQPAPTPPPSGQRYRGPSDKLRSRRRAANWQAASEAAAPVSTVPPSTAATPAVNVPPASPLLVPVETAPLSPNAVLAAAEQLAAKAATGTTGVSAKTVTAATAATECEKTDDSSEVASTSRKTLLPPTGNVKCWNCDRLMAADHQCDLSSGSSSVTETGLSNSGTLPGTPPGSPMRRIIRPKKFCDLE